MANETHDLQQQEVQKQEVEMQGAERTREQVAFIPRVDIYETNDAMMMVANMPGVDENNVEITLEKGVLTIKGYVPPTQFEGYSLVYAEYREGDYERSFTLSNDINQEAIEATMKDGVLRLRLPKISPTTRKIAVKSA